MLNRRYWHGQGAYRAELSLRPLVPLAVQSLVLQLGRALLAGLLVLLAVGPLAVDATVFDEEAGTFLSAVGANTSTCRQVARRCHGDRPVLCDVDLAGSL